MQYKLISVIALVLSFSSAFAAEPEAAQPSSLSTLTERVSTWARGTQSVQSLGLRGVLEIRCSHYLSFQFKNPILSQRMNFECTRATHTFMSVLKPTIVSFEHPLSGVPMSLQVAFPDELLSLFASPRVVTFLKAWLEGVNASSLGVRRLDTFALAVKHAGSEAEALRLMAVVLQDTSAAKVQIQFLKAKISEPSAAQIEAVQLLDQVIDQMVAITEGRFAVKAGVEFYPLHAPGVAAALAAGKLGARIYHYYVPAYVAMKMNVLGRPKALAFFYSFLFNYLYEAIEESNPILRAISEPRKFSEGVNDVYLGYLGAAYGSHGGQGHLLLSARDFGVLISKPAPAIKAIGGAALRAHKFTR